jgi:hypothetical protein
MQLFLDCDGVLADFDKFFEENYHMDARQYENKFGGGKFWYEIQHFPGGFFRQLPPMPDAHELVDAVRHLNPIILTGAPLGETWPQPQKEAWRDEHFPDLPMICCQSKKNTLTCSPAFITSLSMTGQNGNTSGRKTVGLLSFIRQLKNPSKNSRESARSERVYYHIDNTTSATHTIKFYWAPSLAPGEDGVERVLKNKPVEPESDLLKPL